MLAVTLTNEKGTVVLQVKTFAAAFAAVEGFIFGATGRKITVTKDNLNGYMHPYSWLIE